MILAEVFYPGTVYLIHFDTPFKHARHYIGWTAGRVEDRLQQHLDRQGRGSRLLAYVDAAGINWELVRTWDHVDRKFERRLKNQKNAWRLCPVCIEERAASGGKHSMHPAAITNT